MTRDRRSDPGPRAPRAADAPIDRRAFLGSLPLAAGTVAALADPAAADAARALAVARVREGSHTIARPRTVDIARPRTVDIARPRTIDGWGVQLFTLRERLAAELRGTLEAVAAIGYTEVELFALHGLSPRELRAELDAVGLRATSSHYGLEAIREDLDGAVDGALELGQSLMVVPSVPAAERTRDGLARVADDLNRAGERAGAEGVRVGYHNHDWELRPFDDGTLPLDVLLDRTDPALVDWQMDIFWTVNGGADPMAVLGERAGRVTSVHVKDRTAAGRMVDVGQGAIDFATILREAESQGLMHAFVEHDRPGDAVASVRRSYEHLVSLDVGP